MSFAFSLQCNVNMLLLTPTLIKITAPRLYSLWARAQAFSHLPLANAASLPSIQFVLLLQAINLLQKWFSFDTGNTLPCSIEAISYNRDLTA
ncbi:hypothetical protein J4727_03485 [Providencia rettgeri]|uniref:Uncharacterized protein n=1 Tax=Providencia rettgeri TaxID=587 RepID=A0A939NEW1_PRORE|nr:hypothetical protein [Providencia rettgeri]